MVDVGELDPEAIHLPNIYVDRLIVGGKFEKRIEVAMCSKIRWTKMNRMCFLSETYCSQERRDECSCWRWEGGGVEGANCPQSCSGVQR